MYISIIEHYCSTTAALLTRSREQQTTLTTRHGVQHLELVKIHTLRYQRPAAEMLHWTTIEKHQTLVMPQ